MPAPPSLWQRAKAFLGHVGQPSPETVCAVVVEQLGESGIVIVDARRPDGGHTSIVIPAGPAFTDFLAP